MSLSAQIAKNTSYLIIGRVLASVLGIISVALLLRYLSPDDYGRYITVISFVLLFGTFVDLGLNLTTTQDISVPGRDVAHTLSSIFTLRLIINIGLVLLLPIILLAFPYEQMIKTAIMISSTIFFTFSLFQVLASYFQKELQAEKVAIADLLGKVALLLVVIVAVKFKFSFIELIIAIMLSSLVQLWVLLRFTSKVIKLKLCIDLLIWKRILKKTWPIALSVIFTTIYFKGDAVILSLVRPYGDVGIYGASYKILEVLITLPILFMGLVLPHLAKSYAENNKEKFNKAIQKSWDALSLFTLPLVIGTLVLAEPIILLIAGKGYEPSIQVLRILIVAAGIIFLGSLFTHTIVAINKQKSMIKYYAIAAVLAVVLYIIYIPTYTYYAAAIVTVIAELLIATAALIKVYKTTHFKLSFLIFNKTLFASAIMGLILYLLSGLHILILVPVGVIVYFIFIKLLRAMPIKLS